MNIAPGGEATRKAHPAEMQAGPPDNSEPPVTPRSLPVPPPDRDLAERVARAREAAVPQRKNPFLAFLTSRRLVALIVIALVIYLCFEIPHLYWAMAPELSFKIAVVDKTVPFPDRREHKGLFWILIQNKFVDTDKPQDKRYYDYKTDYSGFFPNPETTQSVPGKTLVNSEDDWKRLHGVGSDLTAQTLADRDLLYFTDTYGVYAADYTQFPYDTASTIHSPQIYGGLNADEMTNVEQFAQHGKTVIAEFNSFASPTPPDVRTRFENLLGVKWTGWIGRYFVDFRDEKDVPHWLYQLYEKQYKKKWDLTGSGYMLCRNESEQFLILRDGIDVNATGMEFVPQPAYMEKDVMQGVKPCTFRYWFDVVEAAPGTEQLAQFQFHLSESGQKALDAYGLPRIFPAICRRRGDSDTYYISGEMVDFNRSMGPPNSRLPLYVNRSFFAHAQASNESFFFWHTAYPLETNILRFECNRLTNQPKNVFLFK